MAGGVTGPGRPRVEGIGAVSTGCLLWRYPDRVCATIVVKATFALVADGPMVRVEPEPIVAEEENHDRSPARSLRRTIDLAPFSERADVVVTGHACVPGGRWAPRLAVRLAVYRGAALFDKALVVYGDRPQGQPKPFQRMPIAYERAYGGVGYPENPLGRGFNDGKQPNIELPDQPGVMAGLGPIGRSWSARRKRLTAAARKAVMAPVPEVGADFDWAYFQAAPPDQQVDGIAGDEWIVLEGMHPDHARLQSCLPGVSAEMFLHGPDLIEPTPVGPTAFRPDLVSIDADTGLCSVTWRAVVCAERAEQIAAVRVMVGVAERGAPIAWPAPDEIVARWEAEDAAAESDAAPTARLPPKRSLDHTLTLSGLPPGEAPPPPIPFAVRPAAGAPHVPGGNLTDTLVTPGHDAPAAAPGDVRQARRRAQSVAMGPRAAPNPGAQRAPVHAGTGTVDLPLPGLPAVKTAHAGEVTLTLDVPAPAAPAAPAASAPPVAPAAPTARIQNFTTTLAAEPDAPAGGIPKAAMPFAAVGPGVSPAAHDTIPGAPWPSRARAGRPPKLPPRVPPEAPLYRTGAVPILFREALTGVALPSSLKPPQPSLTVVVKGTFDIVPGGRAALRAESESPQGDVHAGEPFVSSVLYPSDLALFKPQADVLLVGHAYPAERRARHSHVRFRFGKKAASFDRRAAVIGDRFWERGVSTTPASFAAMPLVHERAFGGPETPVNPAGRGRVALPDGRIPMPNIEDPDALVRSSADAPEPVAFCGVPMRWPARWSKLGTYSESTAADRWPHFAEDFDWAFFQAAPPEQRLPQVDGDEPFLLAGVHPKHAVLEGELPHLSVRCFAQLTKAAGGAFHEVFLRLDTVVLAPDTLTLHLVWRGVLEVTEDDAPEIESLFVMTRPMRERAATPAEAQAAYIETTRKKEASPGPVAPAEPAPEPDAEGAQEETEAPPESGTQAKVDRHLQELREKVAALGVTLPPLDGAGAPPPAAPATLDPEVAFAKMRAGGMKEQDIAELRETLRDLAPPDAPPDTAAGPETQVVAPEPETGRLTREAVVAMLAAGESFDGLDLSELDLSELDFSGRSLLGTRLGDACLFASKLAGAKLEGAQLGKADLREADLTGADLAGADLHGADLRLARLVGAILDGADFSACHAKGATFERARGGSVSFWSASLSGVSFAQAELPEADFTASELDDTSFENALLPEVRLYDAVGQRTSFRGASMKGARAEGASFENGRFRGASAEGSIWDDARLTSAVFLGASLAGASFLRARCEGAVLANCDLSEARLGRAKLSGASFSKSKLAGASFEGADLSHADLRGACLHRAETWKAKLRGASTEGAILSRTRLARRA